MLKLALFAACSCVLIEASSSDLPPATDVPPQLVGRWLAEDIGRRGVIDFLQTTIEINDDGTYAGFAGCNSFTGTFAFRESKIVFGPAGTTRKLCPPAIMDQEQTFLKALKPELSWTVEDTKLQLIPSAGLDSVLLVRHDE